jgi:hypothetical protein
MIIYHISTLFEFLKIRCFFIVARKSGKFLSPQRPWRLTLYVYLQAPDIFPDPETAPDDRTKYLWAVRRELRGLIFDESGQVISRRFHKFFNSTFTFHVSKTDPVNVFSNVVDEYGVVCVVGELPETKPELIDLSKPFTILEKLDGSMIGSISCSTH